jgi:ketosteroid isomerase-like protein
MSSVLEEKDRIRELTAEYCAAFDEARFDDWVELWADDALFVVDGLERRGRAALQQFTREARFVDGKLPYKHDVMNHVIQVEGDSATAKCYLLLVFKKKDGSLAPATAGVYDDKLVKVGGRWKFTERRLRGDLRGGSRSAGKS